MTFQHHLENAESYDENSKIISKSLLKKFTLMVKAYHDKNNNKHKYTL
jgi:hypothetical protein